jgi:glutathione S-transferase
MLKLYHSPISPNSRRVWITLLEKGLEFEKIELQLDGEQFQPNFLAINPFHHIPALVDNGFNVVESLAILDYLEAKYPTPKMLPHNPQDLAVVKMVELVAVNELLPSFTPLFPIIFGFPIQDPEKVEQAKQKIATIMKFLEDLLDDRPFFGSETITLAEPVAGSIIPWLSTVSISLTDYPKLNAWCDRLTQRPSWQETQPTPEAFDAFKSRMQSRMK